VQEALAGYETPEGVRLAVRVAVGAGPVRHLHLGGVFGRCEFLAVGEPFADVGSANKQVRPEDVVVAPRAWQMIGACCEGEVLPSGDVRLREIREPLPLRPLDRTPLTAEAEPVVRGYIPAAVRARLEAGQTAWVGELRPVTVLFMNLPEMNARTAPEQAQAAMCELQNALYHYEGSINKLSVDDKGVTLVAALGLPPLAHEDDPVRGVQAAMALHARVRALGWSSSIGVTSGRAFCGAYGSPVRREYTMIGKVVNLAARLMQAAHGGVLCDEATYRAAQARLRFETLPAILVKGRTDPVPIFRPLGPCLGDSHQGLTAASSSGKPLVGRKAERQALLDRLQALRNRGEASVVVVEGEAGIGKSRLLWDLIQEAKRSQGLIAVLSGGGDAINKSTPYFAWRPVFQQLFGLGLRPESSQGTSPEVWRQQVLAQLDDPELVRLAPLLGAVLPGDWPANEVTAEMSGEVRGDNTNRLLLRLLAQAGVRGQGAKGSREAGEPSNSSSLTPVLLTLDDCQWLDSASWALARLAARDVPSLLLVLSTRPMVDPASSAIPIRRRQEPAPPPPSPSTQQAPLADPLPLDHRQLLYAPTTHWLRLDALPPADTAALVCQRLEVRSLPAEVAGLIYEKAQGNPYFSEELAYALRDAGLIEIAGSECRLRPTPATAEERLAAGEGGHGTAQQGFRDLALPDTVQGVVTSRIDRLGPAEQLALKVASVIGRVFSLKILRDLYPIEADRPDLPTHLRTLKRLDLTRLESPENSPELAYSFKHTIIREVVYNLMLVAQRQTLHRQVAEWYEQHYAHDLAPHYALLAYHWGEAEHGLGGAAKAIDYLEKAGELALRSHANEEAIAFFGAALARDGLKENASNSNPLRRACWERQLGEAHYAQGNMAPAQVHLERAVALLGFPVPASRWRRFTGSVRQFLCQLLHRTIPALFIGRGQGRRDLLLEAVRSDEGLASIYYENNAKVLCLYTALRSLNLAEAAGPAPELAKAYANASIVFGLMGLHGIAEAHARRALATAQEVNLLACSSYVHEVTGMYWYTVANWEQAQSALGRAAEIAETIGDDRRLDEVSIPRAMVPFHHLGDFRTSAAMPVRLLESARRRAIPQVQCWALSWRLVSLLPLLPGVRSQKSEVDGDNSIAAQVTETIAALESLLTRNPESANKLVRADQVFGYGVLAQARWRRGEIHLAVQAAGKGAAVSALCEPVSHYVLVGYVGLLEVYTGLWEAGGGPAAQRELSEPCRPLARSLWKFARMHPVGYPQAWRWRGVIAWLEGRSRRARRALKKALAAAVRLGMPHDEALIHYEIGRHTRSRVRQNAGPPTDARVLANAATDARRDHLLQARAIFARLGAAYDLDRVDKALEDGQG
jgi:tetratricopeptide (TPR) repeat protein